MAYFVARLVFRLHPVIPFLLLLGIASDGLAFVALAVFNPSRDPQLVSGALILAAAIALAAGLRRWGVRSFWPYLLGAGVVSWLGFYQIGLHPALALVPIMPFLPHAARDPGFFVDARPDARDALSQFEVWWKYPAQVALFFFGLVNAGVPMGALEAGTWGLPLAVLAGKPLGLLLGAGLALAMGLHLPHAHWLARADRHRPHCRDRPQCRAVPDRGAAPARAAPLGDQHGRPPQPRRWTAGAAGGAPVARRAVCSLKAHAR